MFTDVLLYIPAISHYQVQQCKKRCFVDDFNGVLEFVTSWKRLKNGDDSSCTQGHVTWIHKITLLVTKPPNC